MAKLNQIIAVEKGVKAKVYGALTTLHKTFQKPELFNGFSKNYQPIDDENGEKLPPESKRVGRTVQSIMEETEQGLTEHFQLEARKDWTNCVAKADVVIDGETIIANAPTTFLLFLEKQLVDLKTMISTMPTLDIAEDWIKDPNSGLYKTEGVKTHRTKKVQRPIVMYDATAEHPAQTQLITEDTLAGHWNTVKQSGAISTPDKKTLYDRADKLLQAVKQAREAANGIDEASNVPDVGTAIFGYLRKQV